MQITHLPTSYSIMSVYDIAYVVTAAFACVYALIKIQTWQFILNILTENITNIEKSLSNWAEYFI